MNNEEFSPKRAKLLTTTDGHEVVVGRVGSGKTTLLKQRINNDVELLNHVNWVINLHDTGLNGNWVTSDINSACSMLDALENVVVKRGQDDGTRITVTIDDATTLFENDDFLTEFEFLLQITEEITWVKFRVAIQSTLRWGVRGSTILYDYLLKDAKETN